MNIFKKLYNLLTTADQKNLVSLLAVVLIMALLDMIGVASIMPFIAVLTNPQLIDTNIFLAKIYQLTEHLGVTNNSQFLTLLGIFAFLMLIISLSVKMVASYLQFHFLNTCEFNIGKRLMERYLNQPYDWFLNRNSSDLGKNILSEVATVVDQGIQPLINLFVYGSVSIALLILLVLIDPNIALVAALMLGIAYGIIFKFVKGVLLKIGEERVRCNKERFIAVNEAFGAAKALKVGGLEEFFIQRFSKPAKIYAKNQASVQVISALPRYFLEAVAFGGMILLILFLMNLNGDFSKIISIISVYAFAGYRLMPALQQIYWSFSQLRFSGPALEKLDEELINLQINGLSKNHLNSMLLKQSIILDNIHYTYPNTLQPVLKKINLTIPVNSIIGLAGATGSGKTTLVDIILGLLEAQEGKLIVDNKIIKADNRREWQNTIGYVPQSIYLSDDSITANIAFGVEPKNVDKDAVELAAKIANIHNFINIDLPNGYKTIVGDRGARLSGGQIQRIGIARALYHRPKVLILDEATSALDGLTEDKIIKEVLNLKDKITIILIAHRLNTLQSCKEIYFFENGKVKTQGTFDYILEHNENFKEMVRLGKESS